MNRLIKSVAPFTLDPVLQLSFALITEICSKMLYDYITIYTHTHRDISVYATRVFDIPRPTFEG